MSSTVLKIVTQTYCSEFNETATACSPIEEKIDIFRELVAILSQTVGLPFQVTYNWIGGILLPDGNWTGMIGAVNRCEVDMAIAPFIVTLERSEAISFSYPFRNEDYTFATRKPEFESKTFGELRPFSLVTWLTWIASMAFLNFVLCLLFRGRFAFSDITLDIVAGSLKQPVSIIKAKKASDKMVMFTWMLATTVLTMSYVSVLLSVLTVPILAGVRTVPQLAEAVVKNNYRCMSNKGSSLTNMLANFPSNNVKIIGDSILKNPGGLGTLHSFLMTERKVAYVSGRQQFSFLEGRYFVSRDSFFENPQAFAVRRDFPHKRKLETAIHRMASAGLFEKAYRQMSYFTGLNLTSLLIDRKGSYPRRLALKDLDGAFILLVCGHILAGVTLLAELAYGAMKKKELKGQKTKVNPSQKMSLPFMN